MRDLTWDDFRDAAGSIYQVETVEGPVALTLEVAQALPETRRAGGAFRLEVLGPVAPVLPQSIYRFAGDSVEPFEIFIVPVGAEPGATRYEALFY